MPSQPTHVEEASADKYYTTQPIPTSGFPTNSKASSMEQHNKIPGLFITKKYEARSKRAKTSTKRKLENVFDFSPNQAIKPQQVTWFFFWWHSQETDSKLDFDIQTAYITAESKVAGGNRPKRIKVKGVCKKAQHFSLHPKSQLNNRPPIFA